MLPALTSLGYEGMAISDGTEASLAYLSATCGDMPEEEKQQVRDHLLEYCGLDTGGMIRIVERLGKL